MASHDIPPPPYKVVLLGESSVGKTSLVTRFTANKYNHHTANTIGGAFLTKQYQKSTDTGRKVQFEIWDTAGQERYRSLTPMYYRNARLALVCFDLTSIEETLHTAQYWLDQLAVHGTVDPENPLRVKLLGTKNDLLISEPLSLDCLQTVNQFCEANAIAKWYRTSARAATGITEVFDDIVDEIDPAFFTDYYNNARQENPSRQTGLMAQILSSRGTANSKCC